MHLFEALTTGKRNSLHDWTGSGFRATPWDDVVAEAHRVAAGLRDAGVGPGVRVASILTNSREAISGMLGVWLAGGSVASLPIPARAMSLEEYAAQTARLVEHMEAAMLVTDAQVSELLPEDVRARASARTWESLPVDRAIEPSPPELDAEAFVQYSSGSTSMPKGCVLSARAIGAQLEIISNMVDAVPGGEAVASWLPLSHDMGLFGCLLFPWAFDDNLVLSTPERFMLDPRTWLGDCAYFGATATAGPPSALPVAARSLRTKRLSAQGLMLRACVVGAERIAWSAVEKIDAALEPYGMDASVLVPAYGLAEATLAVTANPPETYPRCVHVDSTALAEGEIREVDPEAEPTATGIVSVGRALDGVEVRMAEEGRLSEIHVSSPSLADGYLGDPELTAARFRDGGVATGDLGFMLGDELFVAGRTDDLLTVGGRNVYARQIETAVEDLDPVRNGCTTIVEVSDDGRGRLVMLLELADDGASTAAVAESAARIAAAKAGVLIDECVFLPRGGLPKTPTGKPQRFRCRQLVMTDGIDAVARVQLRRRMTASA